MHEYQLDSIVRISKKILKKDLEVIVEIGARDCSETLAFHHYFPLAHIYSFECNPDTLAVCRDKVKDISHIYLIEKAITDKIGSILFFKIKNEGKDWNPGGSSLLLLEENIKVPQEEIIVECSTLDIEMKTQGVSAIDLIWMDIQGAELSALKGADNILLNISLIHTEVEFHNFYKNQPLFTDISAYLNDHGFHLLTFTSFGKYSGDAVFINNKIKHFRIPECLIIFYFRFIDIWVNKRRGLRKKIGI